MAGPSEGPKIRGTSGTARDDTPVNHAVFWNHAIFSYFGTIQYT